MTAWIGNTCRQRSRETIILTVSGVAAQDAEPGVDDSAAARVDYAEMRRQLGYEVVDETGPDDAALPVMATVGKVPGLRHIALAAAVFRRRSDTRVIVTDAEHTGLPLAVLLRLFGRRGVRHVMIGHVLSSKGKPAIMRALGLAKAIDHVIVFSTEQLRIVQNLAGFGPSKVSHIGFGVDERFFEPVPVAADSRSICSVGLEGRDYQTLLAAVDGLDIDVEIAAGSRWATGQGFEADTTPSNVTMLPLLGTAQLRELYQRSRFVVIPLHETDFQAGVTSIIEAMASGRAVIYTRTRGQTDVVIDGVTGVPVEPGDVEGLRSAIAGLFDDRDRADRMGRAARERVERHFTLDGYVEQIGEIVEKVAS